MCTCGHVFLCVCFLTWHWHYIHVPVLFTGMVCGDKCLLIFVWCGPVSACAWIINSLSGSTDCLFSLLLFLPAFVLPSLCPLFSFSHPHLVTSLHPPCLLQSPSGLQLPSSPARSPWNPPRTINIVWERSLGKHEPLCCNSTTHIYCWLSSFLGYLSIFYVL